MGNNALLVKKCHSHLNNAYNFKLRNYIYVRKSRIHKEYTITKILRVLQPFECYFHDTRTPCSNKQILLYILQGESVDLCYQSRFRLRSWACPVRMWVDRPLCGFLSLCRQDQSNVSPPHRLLPTQHAQNSHCRWHGNRTETVNSSAIVTAALLLRTWGPRVRCTVPR